MKNLIFIFGEGSGNCSRQEKIFFLNDFRDRVCGRGIRPALEKQLFTKGSKLRKAVANYLKTTK